MFNIKDLPMVKVLLSYLSQYGTWCTDKRMYIPVDSHMAPNFFKVDELPFEIFLGKGLCLRAEAPLLINKLLLILS